MWLVKLILIVAMAYGAVIAAMYAAQTWLLFPTGLAAAFGPSPPADAVPLDLRAPDGTRLQGLHIPPAQDGAASPTTVLGFGGNAWNAESLGVYLHRLFPDADVVVFHYRGYGKSEGRPSTAGLLADAPAIHDGAVAAVGPGRVLAVGFSIGSGVAAHLATVRPLSGLILVSPFDSLTRLAQDHYPWAPVRWLLRHRMDILESVRTATVPTAVIAAGRDTIVPPRRTDPVRRAVRHLVFDRTIPDAGHNDLYQHPAFGESMVEARSRIDAASTDAALSQPASSP